MRHTLRALVSLLVISCCLDARAEETGSRWWPFGRDDKSEATASPTPSATEAVPPLSTSGAADASGIVAAPPAQQTVTQPAVPDVGPVTDGSAPKDEKWMLDSPKGKVSWPRLKMPEMGKPKLPRPQLRGKSPSPAAQTQTPTRNSWADKPVEEKASPMQAMSNGARRMSESTKKAWHKTVDAITPGSEAEDSPRVAASDAKPSLWKRMFGGEEKKDEGPQTVTEWMAQDRLDP